MNDEVGYCVTQEGSVWLKIRCDKEGDILEIKFSESNMVNGKYIRESGLTVDYDREGNIVVF